MDTEIITNINYSFVKLNVFLGLTIGLFLLLNKSAKNKANIYFGLLLIAITAYSIPFFLHLLGLLKYFPHVVNIHLLVGFTAGPAIYFYVRACTQKDFKFRAIHAWHLVPFLLNFIFILPKLWVGANDKMEMFQLFLDTRASGEPVFISVLKMIHSLTYYSISAVLVLRYRKHLTNTASAIDVSFHRWLLIFCITVGLPIIGLSLSILFGLGDNRYILFNIGNSIFFLTVYLAALKKPQLFHAFPHPMPQLKLAEVKKQKYENSNLQEGQKQKYVKRLEEFVEKEKPYQAPELTLAQLSDLINIPAHYLSQIINEKLNCNFLDFINSHRVKAAQEMLLDEKYAHYTILAIAFESGFNSKSTFYTAFKKSTGLTPSAYRKKTMVA